MGLEGVHGEVMGLLEINEYYMTTKLITGMTIMSSCISALSQACEIAGLLLSKSEDIQPCTHKVGTFIFSIISTLTAYH